MGLLAVVNLVALAFLFKIGKRVLDDFADAVRHNPDHPVLEASRFQDLDLDPRAWSPETTREAID
jgi:AGCS family alanine or glycine:cation symporter